MAMYRRIGLGFPLFIIILSVSLIFTSVFAQEEMGEEDPALKQQQMER